MIMKQHIQFAVGTCRVFSAGWIPHTKSQCPPSPKEQFSSHNPIKMLFSAGVIAPVPVLF